MRSVVKLKRTQLLEASGPIHRQAEVSQLKLDDLATVVSDTCPMELRVTQAGSEIQVKGLVRVALEETCDRCLTTFEHDLTGRFSLILTENESLYSEDMDDVYPFPPAQVEFDFGPVVSDAIRLERPMKQLCKENCKGLCPHCGTNLNETDCECQEEIMDERWAPLKAFQFPDLEG